MIKRRFYKVEHGDGDDLSASSSSSSSSDSDIEAEPPQASDADSGGEVGGDADHSSTSSGPLDDEDDSEIEAKALSPGPLPGKLHEKTKFPDLQLADKDDAIPADALTYVLKCKSTFKCRICPGILCLNEDSLRAHLKSKRHVRSEKLLNDGRLKSMLNSDGEIEDQETASEMHARIMSLAQVISTNVKKGKPHMRKKSKRMKAESELEEAKQSRKRSSKKHPSS
ncbi:hypothetical protein SAY86_023672 [Trapa natans]|uniref:Uncharacterized protein n=1 Tax=Trapa natans TaxID=22666 RepID=A0AAN7M7P8_TRANT|nr:hypothetical protein SAY86_023672 [Trapa natans]